MHSKTLQFCYQWNMFIAIGLRLDGNRIVTFCVWISKRKLPNGVQEKSAVGAADIAHKLIEAVGDHYSNHNQVTHKRMLAYTICQQMCCMPNAIKTATPCLKHLQQRWTPCITSSELNNGMKRGPMPHCQNEHRIQRWHENNEPQLPRRHIIPLWHENWANARMPQKVHKR